MVLATPGGLRRFVRYTRRSRGWNQARLAGAVGRSQQWVSKFESGRSDVCVGDVLGALSALGVTIVVRAVGMPPGEDGPHG